MDACDYYRALYQAMGTAQRYVLLAGWQFDSDVRLLRGEDARGAPWPVELLPFLSALCRERPELHVYVLAWDYSVLYTLEREWMQRLKFDFGTSDRVEYVLDGKHPVGASHHQKLVVVDGGSRSSEAPTSAMEGGTIAATTCTTPSGSIDTASPTSRTTRWSRSSPATEPSRAWRRTSS